MRNIFENLDQIIGEIKKYSQTTTDDGDDNGRQVMTKAHMAFQAR